MFIKNYGGEKDITDKKEISLRIMDEKDKIVVTQLIALQVNGKDKHLGIIHDNERIGTTTLKKEIRMELEEYCNKVKMKKYHRMGDKINCISTMIIPRGVYKLRNSALSNEELIELDKIVSKCYRNVCHTGPTFPTCLLYMPSKWGGMGFKRMSDTVNNQKMAHMFRKTNHNGMTRNAILALIELICREKGIETKNNLITEIKSDIKVKDKMWLCSLIEDAEKWNVNLTIGGSYENNCDEWPESRSEVISTGQHFVMDYLTKVEGKWMYKCNDNLIDTGVNLPEKYMHQLNHDQAYLDESGEMVLEILGRHNYEDFPDLEVRIWERTNEAKIKKGSLLKLSQDTPSCGMGCNMIKKWIEVFHDDEVKRVIMDNDSYTYNVTTRKVKEILTQNNPVSKVKNTSIWDSLEKHRMLIQNGVIYTDGSWKDDRPTTEKMFRMDKRKSLSSAAVVIMERSENWKMGEAITIRITADTINVKEQVTNAFTMEAVAILTAAQISK